MLSIVPLARAQSTVDAADASGSSYIYDKGPAGVDFKGGGGGAVSPQASRFHFGLRLAIRVVHDDNIFLSNANEQDDTYVSIEPGITLGFGDIFERQENYLRFDYTAAVFRFSDNTDLDAVQHLFRLEAQYRFARLTLSASQDIQLLDGAELGILTNTGSIVNQVNLDVGGRTNVNIYTTRANANYSLTGKTSISGGVLFTATDYSELISSQSFATNVFFNYAYSPKLVVGFGGTFGYNWVEDPTPDQQFEQINVRATYEATGKLSFNGSIGIEFRQFEDFGRGDSYVSPVFELGMKYQPFDGTVITLTGGRRILNSAVLAQQDYGATNLIFGIRQRLVQRVFIGAVIGYEHANYFSTVAGVPANRKDNYYFIQPAIDVRITRFWTIGFYLNHRENSSSDRSFDFSDNQVGFRTTFSF